MYKIILDTDIGDDIDDAFALGLVLNNPDVFDLKVVTTVFKNTKERALEAQELINLSNRNVKTFIGESLPLNGVIIPFNGETGNLEIIDTCQYDKSMDKNIVYDNAVDEIIRLSKEYPKELIIITIGPMTNVARAIEKDKSITSRIKMVLSMGGWYQNYNPEWNVACDPEAYDTLFKSGIPFYGVGLDVTLKCPLEGDLFTKLRESNNELTKRIMVYFDRWMNYFHFEKSVLHDPLAVSYLIDNSVLTFKETYARIVLEGEKRGSVEVSITPKEGFNKIHYASSVDKEKFFNIIRNNFE